MGDQSRKPLYNVKYVFAQLVAFLDRNKFNRIVRKYSGDRYVKHFTCWNQLLAMMFGQLCNRSSLRDLGIDRICAGMQRRSRITFDLNEIVRQLVLCRILWGASKLQTWQLAEITASHHIDWERVENEQRYGGFYAVCTNLEEFKDKRGSRHHTLADIMKINRARWEMAESS